MMNFCSGAKLTQFRGIFSSWKGGQFLARLHARTPVLVRLSQLCYSIYVGKAEQADFFEGSLFQAVAQVNPTAQNTFLLLTALCSFLASGFIFFLPSCLGPLVD